VQHRGLVKPLALVLDRLRRRMPPRSSSSSSCNMRNMPAASPHASSRVLLLLLFLLLLLLLLVVEEEVWGSGAWSASSARSCQHSYLAGALASVFVLA
jgi:hypothetical protein